MQSNTIRPLMKSVIREDLVALTNNYRAAVVLNQLIYWTKRVYDFDKFLQEEYNRNPECNVAFRYGWIIKTAQELSDETMLGLSRQTLRTILKTLIELELIEESYLDDNKWDKTTKYRLNLVNLQESLFALGYPLNDFTISENLLNSRMLSSQHSRVQIGHSSVNPRHSNVKNLTNNIDQKLHTEIISESSSLTPSSLIDEEKKIANDMKNIWIEEIGEIDVTYLTKSLISNMIMSYQSLFGNSLDNWRAYCRKISTSKFLMGEKKNTNFKAKLSWAIQFGTYHKIEAGEYTLGDRDILPSSTHQKKEEIDYKQELIKLEKHPLWTEVSLLLIERVGGYTFQWLKELDLNYQDETIVELQATNKFVRDWVIKNLINPIKEAIELTLKYQIQHLKIETIDGLKFGTPPVSKVEEGEVPPSSLSSTSNYLRTEVYQNQEGRISYV
jgi:hypothetical protein